MCTPRFSGYPVFLWFQKEEQPNSKRHLIEQFMFVYGVCREFLQIRTVPDIPHETTCMTSDMHVQVASQLV
jgi:hypothetical protein